MLVALTGAVAFYFAKVTGLKEGTSQLAALMIGIWPSYVFNSAIVRRETIVFPDPTSPCNILNILFLLLKSILIYFKTLI